MKPFRFHPAADAEFTDAAQYYSGIEWKLGARFYDTIERVVAEVCAHPQRFRMFDAPVRRHFSPAFPYAVIYLDEIDCVWIVAVTHFKRRPGFWRNRLSND